MARSVGHGRGLTLPQRMGRFKLPPGFQVADRQYFRPFKGMDTLTNLSQVDTSHSPMVVNLLSIKGKLTSRVPLATYGSLPDGPTVLTEDIEIANLRWPFRWSKDKLYYQIGGGDWTDAGITVPTPAWGQLGINSVVWPSLGLGNETLVFSPGPQNNASGQVLIAYTPGAGYVPIDLGNAPSAEHLALFGERIVASYCYDLPAIGAFHLPTVYPNRLKWSVKDDDTNWHGIGSGFEDLIVLSEGVSDDVQGLYPVSDTTALVVRKSTIWRVDLTNFVDAPFLFTLLTDKLGTNGRRTIRAIPGGVVFLGYDDVYVVTLTGIQRIGLPALYSVFSSPSFTEWDTTYPSQSAATPPTVALSWGYYDKLAKLYWLNIKNLGTYIYSFDDQAWTRVTFPFEPWSIAQSYFRTAQGEFHGVYVTPDTFGAGTAAYTTRQDPTRTQDVDGSGNNVDSPIEIRTAFISPDPLRRVQLVEAKVEYECTANQTLIFETSVDGMATWQAYSTQAIVPTTRPSSFRVTHPFDAEAAVFRVRSTTLGGLHLHSLHVYAAPGALINP